MIAQAHVLDENKPNLERVVVQSNHHRRSKTDDRAQRGVG